MVKHTQTIRREIADELFECVWPFYGIGAWYAYFSFTHKVKILDNWQWYAKIEKISCLVFFTHYSY